MCIVFGGVATLLYGVVFGPPFAARDPLIKATATLGLLLILLGMMQWGGVDHPQLHPADLALWNYQVADVRVSRTQIIGVRVPHRRHRWDRHLPASDQGRHGHAGLANDREVTAMLGVPVRRVEAAAWLGSGLLCGSSGVLLGDLVGLDIVTLTFLVIPALAAALDRPAPLALGDADRRLRHRDRPVLPDGVLATWPQYRTMTPFVRHHRPAVVRPPTPGAMTVIGRERRRHSRGLLTAARLNGPGSRAAREPGQPAPARSPCSACLRPARCSARSSSGSTAGCWYMTGVVIYSIVTLGLGPAHRPGRHGLAVPVRPRRRSAPGSLCGSSYATVPPLPRPRAASAGLVTGASARSSGCRRCGCPACTWPSSR